MYILYKFQFYYFNDFFFHFLGECHIVWTLRSLFNGFSWLRSDFGWSPPGSFDDRTCRLKGTVYIYIRTVSSLLLSKFIYSEKATKFCEISTLLLSTVHTDKSKVEIFAKFCGLLRIPIWTLRLVFATILSFCKMK